MVALVVVVALVATAGWVVLRGGGDERADRAVFDEALANLAAAPALSYTSSGFGGAVEVTYRVTATGQAYAEMPPIPGLPGDMSMEQLMVDNKLFFRFDGEMSPEDLGLDPDDPIVSEALEESMSMFDGRWTTSVSEYDGPILRNEMTPVGLAIKLADFVAQTPADRLTAASLDDGTAVYRASTPGGDVYVSRSTPHQVVRFVPAASPELTGEPAPTLPSIPDITMPTLPEDVELPPDMTLPDDVELPPDMTLPTMPETTDWAGQEHDEHTDVAQPPPSETEAPPLLEAGVDRIDIHPMSADEAGQVYADVRAAAEELDQSVDYVLEFAQEELAESLSADIQEALGACGDEGCEIAGDATLIHGRGNEVPTEIVFDMTVDGQPAGSCTARGVIPVSGTGRLGCTNDSEEWVAAFRPGGLIEASATINAMALTPEGRDQIVADIDAHAAEMTDDADGQLRAVLGELGVPGDAWDSFADRAGGGGEAIAAGDVEVLAAVIREAGRSEGGARPLDQIDGDSARRVVERALAAEDRAGLLHAVQTLRAGYDILRRTRQAPGRADSLARGDVRLLMDVAQEEASSGDHTIDLRELQLDAERGRTIDILYPGRDAEAPWQAVEVWHNAQTAHDDPAATLESMELLGNAQTLAGATGIAWFRREEDSHLLFEPFDPESQELPAIEGFAGGAGPASAGARGLPTIQEEPAAPEPPPTIASGDVLGDLTPEERELFENPGRDTPTAVAVFVNGVLVDEVRRSDEADDPDHAEQHVYDQGVMDAALDIARDLAANGEPVTIDVVVSRGPCSARTCGTTLEYVARQAQQIPGATLRVPTRWYYGSTRGNRPSDPAWVRRMIQAGADVRALVPPGGGSNAVRRMTQEVVQARADVRAATTSPTSVAAGSNTRTDINATEQNRAQQRTAQEAYNRDRQTQQGQCLRSQPCPPARRLPPSARTSYGGLRGHLAPQLRQVRGGVPLNPLPCTCPPCGPTGQPSPTPG